MDPDSLVPIYWPADHLEADAIRQALEAEDIPCHIDGENLAGLASSGFFGSAGRWRMRLLVRARDADEARSIIESGDWPRYS